jgi:hypothetical protein
MKARAWVGDKLVSEAEMMAQIIRIAEDKDPEIQKSTS